MEWMYCCKPCRASICIGLRRGMDFMSGTRLLKWKEVLSDNALGILYKISHGIKEGWS